MTAGIDGSRSGLVEQVFRLLEKSRVPWVLLENVPFMLRLGRGRALEVVLRALERLGYRWAYRVVDALAFGLPQRRQRIFIVACLSDDPRNVLLTDDAGHREEQAPDPNLAFGFYWTEGVRGLGAAVDAVPTLKGGSTIGIPSPPAVLMPSGNVVTPRIEDAERLQGFEPGWTEAAAGAARPSYRWKLVGNAVSVRVAEWIGGRLADPGHYDGFWDTPIVEGSPWPLSAWNIGNGRFAALLSPWPVREPRPHLHDFLSNPQLLSARATAGFLARLDTSSLRRPGWFDAGLAAHLRNMRAKDGLGDHSEAAVQKRGDRGRSALETNA